MASSKADATSKALRLCVFGSSSKETPKAYLDAAYELGKLIAKNGHVCITGGGINGCMGAVGDGCADNGGTMEGVIHKMWCAENGEMAQKHQRLSKLTKVDGHTLGNRKNALMGDADCFIALPGGVGTMDELYEVICERQLGFNPRPVILLNLNQYYDGMLQQLSRAKKDKILYLPVDKCLTVVDTPAEALEACVRQQGARFQGKVTDEKVQEKDLKGPGPSSQDMIKAALLARGESMKLQALSTTERAAILDEIAKSLKRNKEKILEINKLDIEAAKTMKMSKSMRKRLVLDTKKIDNLCSGIQQIAADDDPIGRVIGRTEISQGLILEQKTVPIGVLLIIFESRPDCLPQIASLALKSGNGILLKGGKEAINSCRFLHSLITEAIEKATSGKVKGSVVSLVETRSEIAQLLALDKCIDLVIPRGSYGLVNFIKSNTKIPVLGHADGICHIFVDESCPLEMAIRLIIDAKLQYSAACNSVETLLLHKKLATLDYAKKLLEGLKEAGIDVHVSDDMRSCLGASDLKPLPETGFGTEYGDHRISCHVSDNIIKAMDHINEYGSGHTDSILTTDSKNAMTFLNGVASACVFHNASTRFADGFRFGLGAEVGISTGKIHARGPVGVKGLTTTQWALASSLKDGHTVTDFAQGKLKYSHKKLGI
mmetsp:Transcript_30771/g.75018  ORF Transcript_30771/g.75018 Transcript_30771/m.75018 type:complete len:660 (+) Transcript_30771:34-2013(+)